MGNITTGLRTLASKLVFGILCASLMSTAVSQTLPVTTVGRTPGEFAVSAAGQATYQIPIWVPPGVRGVQPQLALSYSSQGGDGLIGPGWSLSGLSQISRCQKTIEQDGYREAVLLTMADALCIDGRRLRVTSGPGTYGQPNSTYQTEVADFSLVVANGTSGNGPAWFEVRSNSGLIYEFGNSASSRAVLPGTPTPYLWALSKVRDRQGNNMRITYAQSGGTLAPSLIEYTQNSASGSAYPYAVSLIYGTRDANDRTIGFIAGAPFSVSTQLLRIDVTRSGVGLARRYNLYYADSATTQRSRLSAVQECSGTNGTDCLSPTQMTYQDGAVGVANPVIDGGQAISSASAPRLVDLNGDARADLLYSETNGISRSWYLNFANQNGGYGPTTLLFSGADKIPVLVDDFLGDGQLGMLEGSSGTWRLQRWNGSAFTAVSTGLAVDPNAIALSLSSFASADINGDGRADLVWGAVGSGGASLYTRLNTSANAVPSFSSTATAAYPINHSPPASSFYGIIGNHPPGASTTHGLDFNGDGRDDVLLLHGVSGAFAPSAIISQGSVFASGFPLPSTPGSQFPAAMNFNNDACTDVMTASVYISPCNGSAGQAVAPALTRHAVVDWNADGRDDIVGTNGSGWFVQLSEGASLASITPISVSVPAGNPWLLLDADHNGDGLGDLIVIDTYSGAIKYGLHNGPDVLPDLLTGITDGFGNSDQVSFKSITRGNYTRVYSAMPPITSPDSDFFHPYYVVDQLTSSDGNGGTYQTQFHYYSARMSLQGRGFKGFAMRRVRDGRNGLYFYDEYRQDFPYIGALAAQSTLQPDNTTTVHRKVNTFNSTTLDASPTNARRFAHVTQTVDRLYEVGGAFNGAHILTRATTNQFDSFGTLVDQTTSMTEIGTGLNAGAIHTERVQRLGVQNDGSLNWCLNKPTTVQYTRSHTLPGGPAVMRTTGYAWDLLNCRPTDQIVEPANSQWRVGTQFGYDAFGNVNSIVVTPATGQGQAARTSSMNWGSDGQFPTSVTNAKGQATAIGWDPLRGVRSSVSDANNLTTSWSYDTFGRPVVETRPDGTRSEYQLGWCNSSNGYCGASALRYGLAKTERDTTSAIIRVDTSYFDAFGRVRRENQETLSGASSGIITNYDARGRLTERSTAFLSGDPIWYTTYTYDLLDRVVQIGGQASETDTSPATTIFAYEGLRTSVTDPLGHTSTVIRSALGEVVQSLDAGGNDTDYEYDAFGNLTLTRDFFGNESTFAYNVRGMKVASNDVDMGSWTYNYFPLGELKSQTTAKNQTTTYTYDSLSRPLTRVEAEGTTTWTWDTATKGVGQLASVSSPGPYSETYLYDAFGRPSQVSYVADGATYLFNATYSTTTGVLETLTYPTSTSSTRVKLRYNYQNGLMQNVRDYTGNVLGTVYWQANATNANSQIIDEQLGNGLQTISSYDRITGRIESRTTGAGGGSNRQNAEYHWDKVGNLTQRRELNLNHIENFYYDALDRIDYSQLNGVTNLDVAYDAIGNITSKTGVGTYAYHATKKHAVVSAGASAYTYDANGNMITRSGASVAWASYNLPTTINQADGHYSQFSYGADRSRYRQLSYSATAGTETTIYIGGLFERVTRSTGTEHKHYVSTPSGRVAVINRKSTGVNEVYYLLRDHLGSTEMITNSSGGQMARLSSDAFGKRRNGGSWAGTPAASEKTAFYDTTHQGFTGHEHLDNLNLVHMNGRVYDPALGRFMSADPFVQAPFFSQSLNRYSYVLNSPLSYTDPSGFYPEGGPRNPWGGNYSFNFMGMRGSIAAAAYTNVTERADRPCELRGTCVRPPRRDPTPPAPEPDPVVPPLLPPSVPPVTSPPVTGVPPTPTPSNPVPLPGPAAGVPGLGSAVAGNDAIRYKLFAFSGAGGWNSGDNPTFRSEASALGAELYLAGPTWFPLGNAIASAEQFIKDNPNGRVNIMGYSAGGAEAIALYHALSTKGIGVDSIVLFDPHPPRSLGLRTFQITGSGVEVWNFFQQNPADVPYNTFRGGRVRGNNCSGCFIVNVNMGLNAQSAFHSNMVLYPYEVHRDLIELLLRR